MDLVDLTRGDYESEQEVEVLEEKELEPKTKIWIYREMHQNYKIENMMKDNVKITKIMSVSTYSGTKSYKVIEIEDEKIKFFTL